VSVPGRAETLILCYHAVSADWPNPGAIEPAALERQVAYLRRRGYTFRTLSDALAREDGRSVVFTFDDAFHSVLERGLPVLRRHRVPATVFVPTDFAEEGAPMTWSTLGRWCGTEHEDELCCMDWGEIRQLAAAGWEIGSHTCSHPDLTTLEPGRAGAELGRSRIACEDALQRPCPALAYPFGAHDDAVVAEAAKAGYVSGVTLGNRLLERRRREDPLRLSREGVYRGASRFHFALAASPLLGRLRGTRLFAAAASAA
jgi:peptidoglycan/xylan/chitin deacetylase (PgdA/CDA1 family)